LLTKSRPNLVAFSDSDSDDDDDDDDDDDESSDVTAGVSATSRWQ